MNDQDAYNKIKAGEIPGVDYLYSKYVKPSSKGVRKPIKNLEEMGLSLHEAEDTWIKAIWKLPESIRNGKYPYVAEEKNALEIMLMPIARGYARNLLRRKGKDGNLPIDGTPEEDLWQTFFADIDLLLAHSVVENMEDPYRTILLIKYFAETPADARKTDEELAAWMREMGMPGSWGKDDFGKKRRRALYQFSILYDAALKAKLELLLQAQRDSGKTVINLCYPIGILYGYMFNYNDIPDDVRTKEVETYLEELNDCKEVQQSYRLRLYDCQAQNWFERIFPSDRANKMDVPGLRTHLLRQLWSMLR